MTPRPHWVSPGCSSGGKLACYLRERRPRVFWQYGGLVLIGKAAVLKTAGFTPLGVRVPRPPPEFGEVAEWLKAHAC